MTYEASLGATGKEIDAALTAKDATIEAQKLEIARLTALVPVTPPPVVTPPPTTTLPKLKKAPPALTNPKEIRVTDEMGKIVLVAGQDAVIVLPKDKPWKNTRGLWVEGGRNVVCIGGQIEVGGGYYNGSTGPGVPADHMVKRPVYFVGQTGTIHLEGLATSSATGDISEGVNFSTPFAVVQIQQCKHLSPLVGTKAYNHADALQCWNGPKFMYVDGFYAKTGYQGAFLNPHDLGTSPVDDNWELNNVEIEGDQNAKYILWKGNPPANIICKNVFTSGGLGNYPNNAAWPGVVHSSTPAKKNFAATAGFGYVSPGYV